MVKIKSLEEISSKYAGAIPRVGEAYKKAVAGVTNWQERAIAGQGLYAQRMSDPEVLARREKKIAATSNEAWRSGSVEKGSRNIAVGMQAAIGKHKAAFAPFREAIAGVTLPEKTADANTNIDNRLKPIVNALQAKKKELG